MKFVDEAGLEWDNSRTPQGVRGLKYAGNTSNAVVNTVAPRKGCVG